MPTSPLFPSASGSREASTSNHAGHVALTIGFGRAFSWELSAITVWSFDRAVVATATVPTTLVVLTDDPSVLGPHRAAVPRLVVQQFNLTSLRSAWRIGRATLTPADSVWFRFALLTTYVERHCRDAELVLLFDLKDILFESSPFVLAPRDSASSRALNTLTSFTEAFPVQKGSWNHKAMLHFKETRGSIAVIDEVVSRRPLGLNSGIMLGPPRVVEQHARRLTKAVLGLTPLPKTMMGIDQGAHNLLVYGSLFSVDAGDWGSGGGDGGGGNARAVHTKHNIIGMNLNGTCPVLTMHMISPLIYQCDEVNREAPGASLFGIRSSASNKPYIMVHQWNRAPETVQRAVLCHHRHILSLPRIRCGSRATCRPFAPEKSLLLPDEREMLHKLSYPSFWRSWCPKSTGCVTDSEAISLRERPNGQPVAPRAAE